MSWTNRMARHGSEKSLHSLSSHSGSAVQSPTSTGLDTSTKYISVNSNTGVGHGAGASQGDSRIPRPSPTSLRRSGSLRVRGERVSYFHTSVTTSPTVQQHFRSHHSQSHSPLFPEEHFHANRLYQDNIFPVITENGTDSPRRRSSSLSLTPAKPRLVHLTPGTASVGYEDSDVDSVKSYGSACSTASACDHATFALNGTTWSGRSRKYVVHCSNHTDDQEHYLTPTQRAARQIRKFQSLLREARKEIEDKDRQILQLTKEVVELRLYKASLNSPEEKTDSSDAPTVRENDPFSPESSTKDLPDEASFQAISCPETPEKRLLPEVSSSLADSGHFEDGSVLSKDSISLSSVAAVDRSNNSTCSIIMKNDSGKTFRESRASAGFEEERKKLANHYESRIEDMHRKHVDEIQVLKQNHNDKVESLLNQLAEVSTRYCEVRPSIDAAEARVHELEVELETVRKELTEQKALVNEQEERNKQMYLKMYAKGQEAARIEQADQILEQAQQTPPTVSIAQLLQQLTLTQAELENIKEINYAPEPLISAECSPNLLTAQEAVSLWVLGTRKAMYRRIVETRNSQGSLDPEITLQFLKSAIYYFLTDKENHHGHLNAIESILGFTDTEKLNIDRIYGSTRK